MKRRVFLAVIPVLVLAACGIGNDPTAVNSAVPATNTSGNGTTKTITIGTANFPESEILGQLWAGVLRNKGFAVVVKSGIGSREVYLKALETGVVDIVPEYTGNLAQFYKADFSAGVDTEAVYASLHQVLPAGLAAAAKAPAESKDSFNVTARLAADNGLKSIADLRKLGKVVLAANPEIVKRPYGPAGLESVYGVKNVEVKPIADGGGPLTIASLISGEATVADIYTTSPVLDKDGQQAAVVRLADPQNLIPAQNVVPVYRTASVQAEAIAALDAFDSALTTQDLESMNLRNVGAEKAEPAAIAADFLQKFPN